ncbi:hypothetical protein JCGZ_27068 [Jatropha curcas]|uniref:Uncharacterized protein n=1 Tax=Jatropha curcas TaxID=180498 RepID=A0A067JJF4_JATCU|nr:hypothetical protein JCGZ_27068 [Jatropha curcas]
MAHDRAKCKAKQSKESEARMPQPMLSRTPVPQLSQTSRGAYAPSRAETHARARTGDKELARAAKARPCYICPKLPEARTPLAVLRRTPVRWNLSRPC